MRNLLFALLAISLLFAFTQCDKVQENNTVVLSGKIENPNSDIVVFSISEYFEQIYLDTAYLDDKGLFYSSFELTDCHAINLNDGKEVAHMYLCPGDSIFITLDAKEFDESIQYEGKGASKNSFLAEYFLKFEDYNNESRIDFYTIRDTLIDIYIDLVNENAAEAKSFLNHNVEEYNFPASFVSYVDTKIYYTKIGNYRSAVIGKDRDTTIEYKQKREQVRKQIMNAGQFENPNPYSQEYMSWITFTLPMIINGEVSKITEEYVANTHDSLKYSMIREYLSPDEFRIYLNNRAEFIAESYNPDRFATLITWIEGNYDDTAGLPEINNMYEEMIIDMSKPVPEDAVLYNLDDEDLLELSFDDVLAKYKGNVIYLDFWASWCGPCKAEMPNSAKLSKALAEEDVVFLYVSTDKDAEAWEKMIRIMQLHGLHYRLGKNTRKAVFETFGIKYIPHYVLFDKEGTMIKNNMSRPSDPKTEKMIRGLL